MKYKRKQANVFAIKFDGTITSYLNISKFCQKNEVSYYVNNNGGYLIIQTIYGKLQVGSGNYIVKNICGEVYPCKEYIFKKECGIK